jgi:phenylacetic acid degradation operon negative regulatory protein
MAASPHERGSAGGQPRLLIMDVCGAFMRPLGGWLPIGKLVGLMAELNVDGQATRSAVSRMRQRGLLVPEAHGTQRGYRLSEAALASLEEADRRIFSPPPSSSVADGWVLVSFSIPEEERDKRHLLRSRLEWLGFGLLANGLWLAPRWIQPELEHMVKDLGFEEYVTVWAAGHLGFGDLSALVARCWDLVELRGMYSDFLTVARDIADRWRAPAGATDDGRAAYVDYVSTLHQWRKFPYLDPGLPREVLPHGWEGRHAADLFHSLRRRLEPAAIAYVSEFVGA